jgi:transposase-like protein
MLVVKGMRFPVEMILVCIRWYTVYPLSCRHLEEMMWERGVSVDHSTASRAGERVQIFSILMRIARDYAMKN